MEIYMAVFFCKAFVDREGWSVLLEGRGQNLKQGMGRVLIWKASLELVYGMNTAE